MGKLTLKDGQFMHTESEDGDSSFYTDEKNELEKSKLLSRLRTCK